MPKIGAIEAEFSQLTLGKKCSKMKRYSGLLNETSETVHDSCAHNTSSSFREATAWAKPSRLFLRGNLLGHEPLSGDISVLARKAAHLSRSVLCLDQNLPWVWVEMGSDQHVVAAHGNEAATTNFAVRLLAGMLRQKLEQEFRWHSL